MKEEGKRGRNNLKVKHCRQARMRRQEWDMPEVSMRGALGRKAITLNARF